jgi:uncharacterized protein YxjI
MYLIRERFFDIGDDFDITDEDGNVLFRADGKVFTLRQRLVLEDPSGAEVASVHRHLVALRPTYEIRVGGETAAEVRRKLFTPFREKFVIDIPGPHDLELKGDLLDHEFTVERDGTEVASVSKKWFRIRDTYAVRVADGEDHLLILATVLALELAFSRAEQQQEKEEKEKEADN